MSNGLEHRIGGRQLPVDGYGEYDGQKVVLQFSGCYYHSHGCSRCPSGKYRNAILDAENLLKTLEKLKYISDLGYTLYHIWECEFDQLKLTNLQFRQFCDNQDFMVDNRYMLTEQQIIADVKSGKIFGLIECDIETPQHLKEIFSEFQPIVKHAFISRDDVGDHMKNFAIENKLLRKPQKTLLCSYYGEKILLASPLLKWYLEHGLEVTHIYQIVQYKPECCFVRFGEEVMAARRAGDQDESKKILSDTSKLIGKTYLIRSEFQVLQYRAYNLYMPFKNFQFVQLCCRKLGIWMHSNQQRTPSRCFFHKMFKIFKISK
jgi:hypothetical protein